MQHHCYFLPYYIHQNNTIKILVGEKRCFNHKDGFIHNNPGQTVICGGYSKNPKNIIDEGIKEFYNETGHVIFNKNKITHILESEYFNVVYYKVCQIEEYISLQRLHNPSHKQISCLKWIPLKYGQYIFASVENNKPCFGEQKKCIFNYINVVFKNGKLPSYEFKDFTNYLNKTKVKRTKNYIVQDLFKNKKKSRFLHLIFDYLESYINDRSYIDWFENAVDYVNVFV